MKKGMANILIPGVVVLIMIISILMLFLFNKEKDNNNDNTAVIFKGDTNKILIDKKLLSRSDTDTPYSCQVSQKKVNLNYSNYMDLASEYLNNPFYDKQMSTDFQQIFIDNKTNEKVIIEVGKVIRYYNDNTTLIPIENKLNNDTIKAKALTFINKCRGNTQDLKVQEISSCDVYKVNSTSGKKTLIGYEYQRIELNQYINAYKVTGAKGKIQIELGNNGDIEYYLDSTITPDKYFNNTNKIENLSNVLNRVSDIIIKKGCYSYEIIDYNFVFYSNERYFDSLFLRWELKMKSKDDGSIFNYVLST